MIYYTVDNPTNKPEQKMDIPFGSRVWIAVRPDSFPNLYLAQLCLDDGNWPSLEGIYPNNGQVGLRMPIMQSSGMWRNYTFYYENDLTLSKLYSDANGMEPFSRTISAQVYGFTRTIDGVTTKTVTRISYTGTDGNSYLLDDIVLLSSNWGNENWPANFINLGILRDSEGTILGNATYVPDYVHGIKVGRLTRQVQGYAPAPRTIDAGNNTNKMPIDYAYAGTTSFGGSFALPDGFATNVAYVGEVEITDCPNITYTLADPITVPITINSQEKSYCYIQF